MIALKNMQMLILWQRKELETLELIIEGNIENKDYLTKKCCHKSIHRIFKEFLNIISKLEIKSKITNIIKFPF